MAWIGYRGWVCAALATVTWGSWAADAQACSQDPCAESDHFSGFDAQHQAVAPDGVLVFEAYRSGGGQFTDEEALAFVTVEVLDAEGLSLEGELSLVEGYAVWRSAEPLPTNTELTVTVDIDQDGLGEPDECVLGSEPEFRFDVGADPLPDLELPEVTFTTSYSFQGSEAIDDLVCCDGAYPADALDSCGGYWPSWSLGFCASARGTGYALGDFAIDESLPEEVAANVVFQYSADGEVIDRLLGASGQQMGRLLDHAFDAQLTIVSLATGETLTSPAFAADANGAGELLGDIEPDITAELDLNCAEPAYVCAVIPGPEGGEAWDAENCVPYEEEPDDSGTDSDTDGGTGTGPGTGTDGPDDDTPSEDEDVDDDVAGEDGDASGCGCRVDGPTSFALGWLVLLGLGAVRKRR